MMRDVWRTALRQPPSRRLCLLVLLAAAALRLALLDAFDAFGPMRVESQKVAVSLATTGQFANAFSLDSGPTAHLGMLTPLLTAAVYSVLGVETRLAELALTAVAIMFAFGSYILASQCLGLLGAPWTPRALALLFLLFVPLQLQLEMVESRYWEIQPATCAVLAMLRHVLRREHGAAPGAREMMILGLISGFVFVLSPSAGLACMALIAILAIRKARPALWLAPPIASLAMIAVLALPWAARNQSAIGHPVWLRSNFGLELALANHELTTRLTPRDAFLARYEQIHPYENPRVLQAMQAAGGEVEYNRRLLDETKAWIFANPASFAMLSLRHLTEFFMPPAWIRFPWAEPRNVWSANHLLAILSAIGVGTLLVRLWRDRLYLYIAAAIFIPALPYIIVQPVNRYRYLISSLLVLLAFDVIGKGVTARFRGRNQLQAL